MNKQYMDFQFEVKSAEVEDTGIFQGYASVFGVKDSYNHIVVKNAFTKSLAKGGRNGTGVALLWAHRTDEPIGTWLEIREDSHGLRVTGKLIREIPQGEKAYQLLRNGAVKHMSIGYDTIVYEDDAKKKIRYLKEVDLWEISLVVFPALRNAKVTGVKAAGTVRELESALRALSLSKTDAVRAISFCKTCEKVGGLSTGNIKAIAGYLGDNQYEKSIVGDAIATCEAFTCGERSTCAVTWDNVQANVKALTDEFAKLETEAKTDLDDLREAIEDRADTSGAKEALIEFYRVAEKANLHLARTAENLKNLDQKITVPGFHKQLLEVSDRLDLISAMARLRFPVAEAEETKPKKKPLTALQNYEKNGIFKDEIPPDYYDGGNVTIVTHGTTKNPEPVPVLGSRAMAIHGSPRPYGFPG